MTTCESGAVILLMHFVVLVLPVAVPLVGLAWVAWRREARVASAGGALVSGVLLLLGLLVAARVGGDAWYFPVVVLPALTSAVLAWWRPARATRVAALAGALVPVVALEAWSIGQVLATECLVP